MRKCVRAPACRYRTTSQSARKKDAQIPVPTERARRKPISLAARSSPLCSSRPNATPSLAPPGVLTADTVSSTEVVGRTTVGLAQIVTVTLLNGSKQSPVNQVRLYRLSTASAQTHTCRNKSRALGGLQQCGNKCLAVSKPERQAGFQAREPSVSHRVGSTCRRRYRLVRPKGLPRFRRSRRAFAPTGCGACRALRAPRRRFH